MARLPGVWVNECWQGTENRANPAMTEASSDRGR